jgi:hypothetical protein
MEDEEDEDPDTEECIVNGARDANDGATLSMREYRTAWSPWRRKARMLGLNTARRGMKLTLAEKLRSLIDRVSGY